jgi:hypothetical protein
MTTRPVFIPVYNGSCLYREEYIDFNWSPGFSEKQKKKNVDALHAAAKQSGIKNILEISSKSNEKIGQRLSAFSLKIELRGIKYPLESVYQGSKVFAKSGPHTDIYCRQPREAKKIIRESDWGELICFELEGKTYPLVPKNAFYDWLYIRALVEHVVWISTNVQYDAYSDIEFNPRKQVNCQARAFAIYKSLAASSKLREVSESFEEFSDLICAS